MTTENLFQIVNTFVLPFWLLLIVYPSWKYRNTVIYIAVGSLAAVYFYLMANGAPMDLSDFSTLEGIVSLFAVPEAVLIGWIHYLAFDLLIGNWIVNETRRLSITHWLAIPSLLLTFMFGPIGFLLFLIIKLIKTKQVD